MRRGILAIGECMVELAPTAAGTFNLGFAGDTFNTAWYLRCHLPPEIPVAYFTAIGTDAMSDRMQEFFVSSGLDTAYVQRIVGAGVGLYLIELKDAERSFSYWRSTSAARQLAADPLVLRRALAGVQFAYFSGITLAILPEADRATLLAELARARAEGCQIAFDPNLRPRLWPSADVMRRAICAGAGTADCVLPSFDEESAEFGDETPEDTARRYADLGAGIVVVKDGPRPVTMLSEGRLQHFAPPDAQIVVDTTAAGDSFNAGFLAAHLLGCDLLDATMAGTRLAGRVIAAYGALVAV